MEHRNLYELFEQVVSTHGERVAFRQKRDGRWVDVTWSRHRDEVAAVSRSLIALGVGKGDRVSIHSGTRLGWVRADTAIVNVGAATVGIYQSNTAADCAFIIEHSGSELLFVENREQLDKILSEPSAASCLRKIVLFDGPSDGSEKVLSWEAFLRLGQEVPDDRLREAGECLGPDDLASLVYTSGTTGEPKGVMITHRNLLFTTWTAAECLAIKSHYTTLMFLPLAHVFARMIVYLCMRRALVISFAEDFKKIPENLKEVRPHFITSVPRIFEKVHETIDQRVAASGGLKRALFEWALGVGGLASTLARAHQPLPAALRIRHALAHRLVLRKIQAAFGGRLVYGVSGAAPLNPAVGEFFHACGVTILQGIGMTENTSFSNVNRPESLRFDTVGPVGQGVEMKVAEDGEVLFRGDNVMAGYFKNPDATARTVDPDGWLHTGDLGEIGDDGHLKITGRKKDLIITAGGKNIAPQRIERTIGSSPYLSHVIVYGDRRKFLTALVTLNPATIREWAERNGLDAADSDALAADEQVRALIAAEIEERNRSLASFETVKKFEILARELSIESGELTPTLKLKRQVVIDNNRELIDGMYV